MKLTLTKNGEVIQKNINADLFDITIDVENNDAYDYVDHDFNKITATTFEGDEFCWEIQEED